MDDTSFYKAPELSTFKSFPFFDVSHPMSSFRIPTFRVPRAFGEMGVIDLRFVAVGA